MLVIGLGAAHAAPTDTRRASVATRYLSSNQEADGSLPAFSPIGSTADAILSFVAARRGAGSIRDARAYLRAHSSEVDSVGEKAKVGLAWWASGRDPRDFVGRDLIEEIAALEQPDGRYGPTTPVLEHALGMLAVGTIQEPSADARTWLLEAQCRDGGWQYDEPSSETDDEHCYDGTPTDFFLSDTNTTGYAVMALGNTDAVGESPAFDHLVFFDSARDPVKGGWVYDPSFVCSGDMRPPDCSLTDANSTALVLQAYATGPDPVTVPDGAEAALRRLQYRLCGKRSGAFAYTWSDEDDDGRFTRSGPDVGATIGAIPGLLGMPFPIQPFEVTKPAPPRRPCA